MLQAKADAEAKAKADAEAKAEASAAPSGSSDSTAAEAADTAEEVVSRFVFALLFRCCAVCDSIISM